MRELAETPWKRVGVLAHPRRPATFHITDEIASWLRDRGLDVVSRSEWDEREIQKLAPSLDLIISIGGDGSVLRAARVCARHGVPIFGVNMGRLGFLTEAGPDNWRERLALALAGDYWLERRMMVTACLWRADEKITCDYALNDVVISRGIIARLVRLETYIDGRWTTTYRADGVIISTPTGSTAYALAVGGPILPPELNNLVVVPICAHLSMDRAIVLDGSATVEVVIRTGHQGVLTLDGQLIAELTDGDRIITRASEHTSSFVRVGERDYFYRSLLDRLEPKMPIHPPPNRKRESPT